MGHSVPSVSRSVANANAALGFWSASAAAVMAVAFAVLAFAFPAPTWDGITAYAATFRSNQLASMLPALLIAPAMTMALAAVHVAAPRASRAFTLSGVAFSAVYTAIVATNYYLQLFVVRLGLLEGSLEGLALLAMPNFHSVFFALEAVGYGFSSLALLVVAWRFADGRLERIVRLLFVINGLIGVIGVWVALLDVPLMILASLGVWCLTFPAGMVALAMHFRRDAVARPVVGTFRA